jgi:hypothetical protein
VNHKVLLILGFAVGVFVDDAVKAIREAHITASGKVAVKTAEQFQKDFYEDRRRAMGDDDH